MLDIIIQAIRKQELLQFSYDGFLRTVEPYTVGQATTGKTLLRCFQVSGGHVRPGHDWDLCDLRKIRDLQPTGVVFATARPDYKRGDKAMRTIYAEL